jgi:threonylcarbamoyladenosine tRNA methylthiotransferase MtaB
MARKTTPPRFAALVASARAVIPELAVTTDVIVGFPGETEAEFAGTLDFVRRMAFAGGHVFTYSERPGTPAACMRDPVPHELRKQRGAALRKVIGESALAYRQKFLGRTLPVLWEATDRYSDAGWQLEGLTDNYLRVSATAPELRWNQMDPVRIRDVTAEGLAGEIQPA